MGEDVAVEKSLVEQIIGDTLASIGTRPEFNAEVLKKLGLLSRTGALTRPAQIADAIKAMPEVKP